MKMMRILAAMLLVCVLTACGSQEVPEAPAVEETPVVEETPAVEEAPADPEFEKVLGLIDSSVEELYELVGYPVDCMYADSCLGEGEDGELYYDGFTVYTYRDTEDNETIYDVMEQQN